jgi:hypothetical protein
MAAVDTAQALALVKARLNRTQGDTSLDDYLDARIEGAKAELARVGIELTDSADDLVLLVDYAVWQYQSRDKPEGMPEWLRLRRRERWLAEVSGDDS